MFEKKLRNKIKERAEAYGLSHLATRTGLSRQALYDFLNGGDVCLSNLLKITKVLGLVLELEDQVTDSDVLANLTKFGAPLMREEVSVPLNLEDTLFEAVKMMGRDGRLTSVLPYLLVKNSYKLDVKKILGKARSQPEVLQLLGYLLDVALAYRNRKQLVQLSKNLKRYVQSLEPVMLREKDSGKTLDYFSRFDNLPAKEWKVGTRDELKSLVERCRKWENIG